MFIQSNTEIRKSMWGRIKGFLLHFFGNIIKLAITVGAIAMLFSLTPDVVADEPFIVIFFLILLTVNVTTTYDFGEFYVVMTEAGVGIVAAFILYFLVVMFVTFLLEHAAVVAGILLLLYAINRGSEVRKYYYDLPKFFMVTGALVAITVLINAIFFFIGGPTAVPDFLYVVDLLIAAIEVINIIARATQADCDD